MMQQATRIQQYIMIVEATNMSDSTMCFVQLKEGEAAEAELPCGLIKGHAYTITDVKKVC